MPPLVLANLLAACLPPLLVPRQPGIHKSGEIVAKSSFVHPESGLRRTRLQELTSRRGALIMSPRVQTPSRSSKGSSFYNQIRSASSRHSNTTPTSLKSPLLDLKRWTQEDSRSLSPLTLLPGAPPIANSKISSHLVHSTSTTTPLRHPPLSHSPFHLRLIPGSSQCLQFSSPGETQTLINLPPTWCRNPRTPSPRGL